MTQCPYRWVYTHNSSDLACVLLITIIYTTKSYHFLCNEIKYFTLLMPWLSIISSFVAILLLDLDRMKFPQIVFPQHY